MTFEELYDWIPGNGWLSREEAQLLYSYIPLDADEQSALEVGCYKGRSTVLLSHLFKKVYAVDPMIGFDQDDPTGEKTLADFHENIRCREIKNVEFYRERIEVWNIRPQYLPISFAYLDGEHTYQGTLNQIAVAKNCKARHIAIHDVNDVGEGEAIKKAALEMLGPWSQRVGRLALWVL